MSGDKGRVVAEIAAAFLGGGDEPATWAAYAYEAGWDAAIEAAAKVADIERQQLESDAMTAVRIWGAIRALEGGSPDER